MKAELTARLKADKLAVHWAGDSAAMKVGKMVVEMVVTRVVQKVARMVALLEQLWVDSKDY